MTEVVSHRRRANGGRQWPSNLHLPWLSSSSLTPCVLHNSSHPLLEGASKGLSQHQLRPAHVVRCCGKLLARRRPTRVAAIAPNCVRREQPRGVESRTTPRDPGMLLIADARTPWSAHVRSAHASRGQQRPRSCLPKIPSSCCHPAGHKTQHPVCRARAARRSLAWGNDHAAALEPGTLRSPSPARTSTNTLSAPESGWGECECRNPR